MSSRGESGRHGGRARFRRGPRGFTVVELLVVTAVVAVVASLALAAVQRSRAAARRAACGNHLRQVGVALHDHHAARGYFPPSETRTWWKMHPQLLPHLGEAALAARVDPGRSFPEWQLEDQDAPGGAEPLSWAAAPAVLACPSDPPGVTRPATATHYLPVTGLPWGGAGSDGFARSVLLRRTPGPLTAAGVRDGLSNTAAVAEALPAFAGARDAGPRRSRAVGVAPFGAGRDVFLALCLTPNAAGETYGRETPWLRADGVNFAMPPNTRHCSRDAADPAPPRHLDSASSEHPGGLNVLLADGAVRFVPDAISTPVWHGLSTIAGGEAAPADF